MKTLEYQRHLAETIGGIPCHEIDILVDELGKLLIHGSSLYLMGNGGSGATASHIAADLRSCGVRAICLNDNVAAITAIANDEDFNLVFLRQIQTLAQPGDVVMVLSGSGHSENIVAAIGKGREMGCITIALTGQAHDDSGGNAARAAHIAVVVPSGNMEIIEDVHMMIGHIVKTALREG